MAVYQWKYSQPVDAQIAGEELERIESKYGSLTQENVLAESTDEKAVLHKCFEWDDTVAARKYRLEQARYIIRSITVVEVKVNYESSEPQNYRAFVNVSDNLQGEFISIKRALATPSTRDKILKDALAELRAFQRKYQIYSELAGVCKAIDTFAASIEKD